MTRKKFKKLLMSYGLDRNLSELEAACLMYHRKKGLRSGFLQGNIGIHPSTPKEIAEHYHIRGIHSARALDALKAKNRRLLKTVTYV